MDRFFFTAGAIAAFIGVALGAFGAHSLRTKLSPDMLNIFEVGVRYQMYHALGLDSPLHGRIRVAGSKLNAVGWASSSASSSSPAAFIYSAPPACAGSARSRRSAASRSSPAGPSSSGRSRGEKHRSMEYWRTGVTGSNPNTPNSITPLLHSPFCLFLPLRVAFDP